jgi:hypothetical protein
MPQNSVWKSVVAKVLREIASTAQPAGPFPHAGLPPTLYHRYRRVLQDTVAATLESEDPAAVEEEMRSLLAALG